MSPSSAFVADPGLRSALTRFVRSRVPGPEVDDIVQATLTDALAAPAPPADPEEMRRWVHGIARNKVVDHFRRRGRELPGDPDHEEPSPDSAPHSARELLRWAEKELPEGEQHQRTLEWMLREGSGDPLEDIAADEKLPAPTVRQRVSRLRRHFRARWAAQLTAAALLGTVLLIAWRALRPSTPEAPQITRETPPERTPLERGIELRRAGLEDCDAGRAQRCLELLDRARALDPKGDGEPRVTEARAAAARALAPDSQLAPPLQDSNDSEKKGTAPEPSSVPPRPRYAPAPSDSSESRSTAPLKIPSSNAPPKTAPKASRFGGKNAGKPEAAPPQQRKGDSKSSSDFGPDAK